MTLHDGFILEMSFVYSMYLNIFFPLIDVYFSLKDCVFYTKEIRKKIVLPPQKNVFNMCTMRLWHL